ncbi:histidine kinase [Novosphingobium sp. ZN18A2]|uniref:sensor histidine kinase n=1 Tax=Novosphingobium sp. ZN18A2 TaxID=3079861 RepID=UPI0030CBAB00
MATAFDLDDLNGAITPGRVPARLVWLSAVALWLCYFVLVTLRSLVIDPQLFGQLMLPRVVVTVAGIVVTVATWPILRRFDERPFGARVAAALVIMLPASILLAAVNQQAFAPIAKQLNASGVKEDSKSDSAAAKAGIRFGRDMAGNLLVDVDDSGKAANYDKQLGEKISPEQRAIINRKLASEGLLRQFTDIAFGRYFLLIAWAALYLALANGERLRAVERSAGELRRAAKAAELRSLRYQVNPHFLFNTLNSLSAQVMSGRTDAAERMIQTISSFYRHSLANDPTADVPLVDEMELQRHYLAIEAVRFPDRLLTEFDVPKALESACVPGMILQPLVENSIKYAVSATRRPVTIRIAAREAGGMLVLTVADDGPASGEPGIPKGGTGIGLSNVRQRLSARFGDAGKVESGPLPAGGYATVLTMPMVRNECC